MEEVAGKMEEDEFWNSEAGKAKQKEQAELSAKLQQEFMRRQEVRLHLLITLFYLLNTFSMGRGYSEICPCPFDTFYIPEQITFCWCITEACVHFVRQMMIQLIVMTVWWCRCSRLKILCLCFWYCHRSAQVKFCLVVMIDLSAGAFASP